MWITLICHAILLTNVLHVYAVPSLYHLGINDTITPLIHLSLYYISVTTYRGGNSVLHPPIYLILFLVNTPKKFHQNSLSQELKFGVSKTITNILTHQTLNSFRGHLTIQCDLGLSVSGNFNVFRLRLYKGPSLKYHSLAP